MDTGRAEGLGSVLSATPQTLLVPEAPRGPFSECHYESTLQLEKLRLTEQKPAGTKLCPDCACSDPLCGPHAFDFSADSRVFVSSGSEFSCSSCREGQVVVGQPETQTIFRMFYSPSEHLMSTGHVSSSVLRPEDFARKLAF